jgi:hypothetical protein
MTIFTKDQINFIIATVHQINNKPKKVRPRISSCLVEIFNRQFPGTNFTFEQIYRAYKKRPKIKV